MAADLRIHFDPQGDLLDATLQCEADVFCEWFGNTREQLAEEYAPYADASVFVAVTEAGGDVIAVGRVILPGLAGQKTLNEAAQEPWLLDSEASARAAGIDVGSTWDSASIAVRRGLRGAGALGSVALLHGLFVSGLENGCTHIAAILDDKVRARLDGLGLMYRTLPGASSAPYLGSAGSTPVYAPIHALLDGQRRINPDAHRLVTLGVGLDGVAVPPRNAFRLQDRPTVVDLRGERARPSVVPAPRDGIDAARH